MVSEINNGQIVFYETVATVIPVLLLVYVAGAARIIKRGVEGALDKVFRPWIGSIIETAQALTGHSWGGDYGQERTVAIVWWIQGWLMAAGIVLTLLFAAAVLLFLLGAPVAGEYFALHALATNRATSEATRWTTIGLIASAVPVVIPPVCVVVFLPVATLVKGVKTDSSRRLRPRPRSSRRTD